MTTSTPTVLVLGAAGRFGTAAALAFHGAGWRVLAQARRTLSWSLLRLVGLVHPTMRELARMSYLWRVPHALDGRALRRAVDALPTTTPAQALRQSLLDLGHLVRPQGARRTPDTAVNAV